MYVIKNLASLRRVVQFWKKIQTLLLLLIASCTRCHMIAYTDFMLASGFLSSSRLQLLIILSLETEYKVKIIILMGH